MIEGEKREFKVEDIGPLKSIKTTNDTYLIELKTNGFYRELEIKSEKEEKAAGWKNWKA